MTMIFGVILLALVGYVAIWLFLKLYHAWVWVKVVTGNESRDELSNIATEFKAETRKWWRERR